MLVHDNSPSIVVWIFHCDCPAPSGRHLWIPNRLRPVSTFASGRDWNRWVVSGGLRPQFRSSTRHVSINPAAGGMEINW